ncbi:MAG: PAS domain-containing protein [Desulfobacterales bacterium]|nr:PAS domain-containing protein [Desulfobacterales bacterium]MCP4160934.1 PAS domain-containing protein [Deltaproteobacteria bacterium]
MNKGQHHKLPTSLTPQEQRRRKREGISIILIIVVVALISFSESQISRLGGNFPVSNTVMMFVLININLLLLLTLIFLVLRNLVKLYYDRKHKVLGAKLRTKLLVAFLSLTLLPTIVLFFFSIQFISSSIEYWFNAPMGNALENSLNVGRQFYIHADQSNSFFCERISYQIDKKDYLEKNKLKALEHYILVSRKEFNIHAIEVYDKNYKRLSFTTYDTISSATFNFVAADDLQKNMGNRKTRTITESNTGGGELIRTISTIPFGVKQEEAKGFVVISFYVTPYLIENIETIKKGIESYRQNILYKPTVQSTYYIALSIVGLLVVFCAVWFAFYLAKTITIPIMELVEGTKRVADGDLGFHIDKTSSDEIGSLVDSFNLMTRDIAISREQLSLSARMLRQQNIEIEERRLYMEVVLKNISAGVISIDSNGIITTINKAAEKLLNLKIENVLQRNYRTLLGDQEKNLIEEISSKVQNAEDLEFRQTVTVDGEKKSFIVNFNVLKDDSGNVLGNVMVFDDLTELEKAQRQAAWREVARRVAHEVKNPLTPISLSAQRLKRKYSKRINEPVFDECTRMIIDHVELIRNLANTFATFAKFPTANPVKCSLQGIIDETVVLYKESHEAIDFQIDFGDDIPELNLDRQQIKQAMINLIDNAISSIKTEGTIGIKLSFSENKNFVRLSIVDSGEGIPTDVKARLFEPYFSTKRAGTGLGLAIVNSIVSDHNATITVTDNYPKGARFIIEFPV